MGNGIGSHKAGNGGLAVVDLVVIIVVVRHGLIAIRAIVGTNIRNTLCTAWRFSIVDKNERRKLSVDDLDLGLGRALPWDVAGLVAFDARSREIPTSILPFAGDKRAAGTVIPRTGL